MPAALGLQRSLRVLATTPNTAAMDVLLSVLDSREPAVRIGAGRALAARPDTESHYQLLLELPECKADVQAACRNAEAVARLRKPALDAINGDDADLCERASHYAVEAEDQRLLPAIVDAAIKPRQQAVDALADAALTLSNLLANAIEAKNRGDLIGEDPAFNRTAALKSLGVAVDRYREHERQELIDAFLMLTTYNNLTLRKVLKDKSHAARGQLLDGLHTSRGYGAMDVLIHALEDPDASQQLVEIAAGRGDEVFAARLLDHVGVRPGIRVLQNVRRVDGFAWAEIDARLQLLKMPGPQQAAAMRLFAAADTEPTDRVALATLFMHQGGDEGRVAACEALRRLKAPEVGDLLKLAMKDPCPEVVAAAVVQLRRHSYQDGLTELVVLLDHPTEVVKAAAQRALGEFSLDSYREAYAGLTPHQREIAGKLVAKADPDAIAAIESDLRAPMVGRRLDALRMIGDLAIVDRLLEDVIKATEDADAGVRAEAAAALGGSANEAAIPALAKLLGDSSAIVRTNTEDSLQRLDSLEVAQGLVDSLEEEFDGDDEPPTLSLNAEDDPE